MRVSKFIPMYFNPRAPRGARLSMSILMIRPVLFQSTRPARGATSDVSNTVLGLMISIHAPREGRDVIVGASAPGLPRDFNPRAPRGARLSTVLFLLKHLSISIHAPREGRDSKSEQISLHIFAKKGMDSRYFCAKRCLSKRFAACRSAKTSLFAVRTAAEISASFCFAL